MAYTITLMATLSLDVWGKTEVRFVQLVPAASDYPTGGYAITPGVNISLRAVYGVVSIGGQGGYLPVWVPTTGKLMIRSVGSVTPSGTISIPIATNVGTTSPVYAGNVANQFTTTGSATSITNATFTGAATAAAQAAEVGAGTDLSSFTFLLMVLGN
jgi:hypothetical protein